MRFMLLLLHPLIRIRRATEILPDSFLPCLSARSPIHHAAILIHLYVCALCVAVAVCVSIRCVMMNGTNHVRDESDGEVGGATATAPLSAAPTTTRQRSRRPSLGDNSEESDEERDITLNNEKPISRTDTNNGSLTNPHAKSSSANPALGASSGGAGTASGSTKKLNRREKRALKSKHRKINKKHPEFELTYDMMLGIRTVVGNNPTGHAVTLASAPSTASSSSSSAANAAAAAAASNAAADADRRRRDERLAAAKKAALLEQQQQQTPQAQKLTFPGRGSSQTPAHAMRDFKFKDYCGELFRLIRARFKIDPTEYLLCVCGNFQYLEFISNSKSGQFFFYSHDRQYMIKTISGGECKFLRTILPSYLQHIEANPHTLLTRFYGMHRVSSSHISSLLVPIVTLAWYRLLMVVWLLACLPSFPCHCVSFCFR